MYRFWGKLRRSTAQSFENKFATRSFFAWGSGKGAGDAIWRQAVRTEAAKGDKDHIAAVFDDFHKFYELVPLKRLLDKANASGLNRVLVRVVLGAYKMQRFFSEGVFLSKGLHAFNGIVAGCSFATAMVKIFYQEIFRGLERRHPSIRFQIYIDDLLAQATGKSERKVLKYMFFCRRFSSHVGNRSGGEDR